MKSEDLAFTLNGPMEFDRMLEEIDVLFPVEEQAVTYVDEQYLDTFDWRMYAGGFVLKQKDERFILASLDGKPVEEADGPRKLKLFWWDFPEEVFQKRLSSLSGNRALCPVLGVIGLRRNFRLHNRDEKMVLRLHLDTGEVFSDDHDRGPSAPYLRLEGVRGYRKPLHRVADLLRKNGWQELQNGENFFDLSLRVINRRPLDYKTKFSDLISPDQTMNQAMSAIGLALHTVMERNLPGILEDVDPEFLHDFRVAIRRTRAFLSQFKNMVPPGQTGYFLQEFKWLGSVAGPVRDLDVCLEKKEVYRSLLPERLHRGLAGLMEEIQQERNFKFLQMRENLQSPRAVNLLANWVDFLTALPVDIQWPTGKSPCGKMAVKIVRRCLRRLVKDAGVIVNGETQDATIHKLRIQAKKFRYMSEFFRRFFSETHMDSLLKELRELQDDLGDFNDLAVQIRGFQQQQVTLKPRSARESLKELLLGLAAEKNRMLKRCTKRCQKIYGEGWELPVL